MNKRSCLVAVLVVVALSWGVVALAAPRAEFVPGRDITPWLQRRVILILIPDARKCTRLEVRTCTDKCASTGDGVVGCKVRTIDGSMTQECTCGNPNDYARNR